jgi:hypothetical protein
VSNSAKPGAVAARLFYLVIKTPSVNTSALQIKKPRTRRASTHREAGRLLAKLQARESRDNPILNAFCRVAPSVRFNVLAILAACFFFLASDFNVRTCSGVHPRRFDTFLAIK